LLNYHRFDFESLFQIGHGQPLALLTGVGSNPLLCSAGLDQRSASSYDTVSSRLGHDSESNSVVSQRRVKTLTQSSLTRRDSDCLFDPGLEKAGLNSPVAYATKQSFLTGRIDFWARWLDALRNDLQSSNPVKTNS
jgi:hypothetical protein